MEQSTLKIKALCSIEGNNPFRLLTLHCLEELFVRLGVFHAIQ